MPGAAAQEGPVAPQQQKRQPPQLPLPQQQQQQQQPQQQPQQQQHQQTQEHRKGGTITRSEAVVPANCNTLVLYRHYDPPKDKSGESAPGVKRMNSYAEAVLHKLLLMPHIPSMMMAMNGEWIVKEGHRIRMNKDVSLAITRIERRDWDVTALELTLFSSRLSATQLVRYVEGLHEDYMRVITNELGSRLYYFDQRERKDYRGNPFDGGRSNRLERKKFDIVNAPQNLGFTRMPFYSNKSFDNLVGPEVDELRRRLDFFLHRRDWYDQKGVPYQFSVLMSGEPGTGKSSCIRAMANFTRRHIINVNFANIKTATQLKRLFYSEDVYVIDDNDASESTKLRIPIADRMFVLEELDALGTTVVDRRNRAVAEAEAETTVPSISSADEGEEPVHDELTLGVLLQVLDGNMETPGRVIIVTTNQPEVLDSALVRPGRIDLNIHFNNASRATLARMYEKLHDVPFPAERVAELPDGVVSPADANEVMFRHMNDVDAYVRETRRVAESQEQEREERSAAVRSHIGAVLAAKARENKRQEEQDAREKARLQREALSVGAA